MDDGSGRPEVPGTATSTGAFDANEIGASLREARLALGRDLIDVAGDLRIRYAYLQAIEEGRLDALPGLTYVSGFLRSYCQHLGLDGREIVNRYKTASGAGGGGTNLRVPSPVEEGRLPTRPILVLAALLAVGAYGAWYYAAGGDGGEPVERVAVLPDEFLPPTEEPAAPVATDAGEAIAETPEAVSVTPEAVAETPDAVSGALETVAEAPEAANGDAELARPAEDAPADVDAPAGDAVIAQDGQPAEDTVPPAPADSSEQAVANENGPAGVDAPAEDAAIAQGGQPAEDTVPPVPEPRPQAILGAVLAAVEEDAPAPAEITAIPTAPEAAAAAAGQATPPATAARIVLRATTDSWLEIAADGAPPVYTGVLRQGQSYEVPAQPGLSLTTGNAGGLDILVDGQAIPRLGPRGAVRRGIALDADSLLRLPGQ